MAKHQKNLSAKKRRGAMAPLICLLLAMCMAMVAFGTDIGTMTLTKTTMRAAADAAALAAAGSMTQTNDIDHARATAIQYAQLNVPSHYGNVLANEDVELGVWDPENQSFISTTTDANAIRVHLERTQSRGNPVNHFFGRLLGRSYSEIQTEAIAAVAMATPDAVYYEQVYVTSTKDLSNVVLGFEDGTHQKFDGLDGYTGTFQGTGENLRKVVACVWIKSGANSSGEGPGYGERIDNLYDGAVTHGLNEHGGPIPHVTATFQATGVEFTESGFVGPVRLVE